jgi:hypothetical protein
MLTQIRSRLKQISDPAQLKDAATQVFSVLQRRGVGGGGFAEALQLATDAAAESSRAKSLREWIGHFAALRRQRHLSLIANPDLDRAVGLAGDAASTYVPSTIGMWGCIPQHPILSILRLHAEVNLRKMRTCRNIAGMKRGPELAAGAVNVQPTLYRYSALINRATQLVQTTAQIESQMLAALEKYDDKSYGLLKARQDLSVSAATVQLHALQVSEADMRVKLTGDQSHRVAVQIGYLTDFLKEPVTDRENGIIQVINWIASNTHEIPRAQAFVSKHEFIASLERRIQESAQQLALANQDAVIAQDQISIANEDVSIANQEKYIADLQQSNATAALNFLTTAFTNPDLYRWMAGVLQDVYKFFLRQATAMARLAENQLGFERQQIPTGYILADYWSLPSDKASSNGNTTSDRKGLTGAERLLEDITQLEQFAFLTDTRKLQLSQTFSLGRLSPVEFQRFRETGVMTFSTPMELFDRSFPGHYLRLVKRVKTSVVALIPPNLGIAATLSTTGLSRVVIGGDIFQAVSVRRDPELVALTSPVNATGMLDLVPQADTMLVPFENTGVDTTWEFRMEKASNLFDYSTIADVLVTIDYTALNSFEYRQQVIQSLSPTVSADAAYSFRDQFADQWYDLHNPDQTVTPMSVLFTTSPEDFPTNIDDVRIQQVLLHFSRVDGKTFEISVSSLRFKERGAPGAVGGGATSIDGTISTRRGNAGSWSAMIGKAPFGDWELVLPNDDDTRSRFGNDDIQDILFIVTYSGRTAEWAT